ncbi:MAG: excinuclease ABC subunit UvrC [Bacteroidetes bacterium]|nr:excinuclease ABC subunit UvrC [Bacteroidota bacterium]
MNTQDTAPEFPRQLANTIASIPSNPGVYQYVDDTGKIIYVGKAKNLHKRVSSYFGKTQTGKLRVLVKKIADIRFIVVETETDALLLENNLIKQLQPRYNVLLKDDKTYPWICLTNELFPRIFPTRNLSRNGSEYFGPYASGRMMHTLLDLIRQLYQVRTCTYNLNEQTIAEKKYKRCLEYQIGNCKGPCEGLQSAAEYQQMIGEIREIIKGNITVVVRQLKTLMMAHAANQAFEKAQLVKEKIEILEKYRSKSTIVNPAISDVDVYSIIDEPQSACVNYLKVVQGAVVQSHSVEIRKKMDESPEDLLLLAITDFRERFSGDSKEIILPFHPGFTLDGVKYTLPQRGDKKQLLELSERNARHFKLELEKQRSLVDPDRHQKRVLNQLKADLRMPEIPEVIECFDNSNFQGDYAVAAMVQFRKARPNKAEYRHFNIKTVEGPDDFASMEEIVFRRYQRLLHEGKTLPQLIVIDGGKGQLGAAVGALEKLDLRGKITIIGIAKRLEEIYFPGDSLPLYIDKRSESLKLIQQLRDEAHRFGITHHRKKFEKGLIKSALTDIEGIGQGTAQKLLWKFKSVKNISQCSFEELAAVVGKAKARIVFDFYNDEQTAEGKA